MSTFPEEHADGWAHEVWKAVVTSLNGGSFPPVEGGSMSLAEQKADHLVELAIERGVDIPGDVQQAVATILAQDLP